MFWFPVTVTSTRLSSLKQHSLLSQYWCIMSLVTGQHGALLRSHRLKSKCQLVLQCSLEAQGLPKTHWLLVKFVSLCLFCFLLFGFFFWLSDMMHFQLLKAPSSPTAIQNIAVYFLPQCQQEPTSLNSPDTSWRKFISAFRRSSSYRI